MLLFLVLIPFIFALICWLFGYINVQISRWIALCGMAIVLVISMFLWKMQFCQLDIFSEVCIFPKWTLEFLYPWIPRFGVNFHLGLDGLSLLMIILSAFLGCMAILCSWNEIKHYQSYFYFNLLWVLGGVIGVFLSIDMFLFFFFWEMILIPMYFLISLWGNDTRKVCVNAAIKFFIYSQCSSLFMLISIITLVSVNYSMIGIWSFDYSDLLHVVLSKNVEYVLMLGFFCAFAVKMPIVPFHAWAPDSHSCAPTAASVDLSGILLKTAAYSFFRFCLPLFPNASQDFSGVAMFLGLLTIFYGAFMAFAQTDVKRFVAYTNISHMGFILIAIYSNNYLSYQGAIIQMIAYSLSTSGMFILCGQLYERLNIRNIYLMGGLWGCLSWIPAFSLCFLSAILGIPGTANFIGEAIMFFGIFQVAPIITVVAIFGIIFTSIYSLVFMQRVYYGPVFVCDRLLKHVTLREKFIVIVLLLCIFLIGFFPQLILDTSCFTMKSIYFWCK